MQTETINTTIERRPEFAGILSESRARYEQPCQATLPRYVNSTFDRLILQSGLRSSPQAWLMLCVLSGVTMGGIGLVVAESLTALGVLGVLGVLTPLVIAGHLRDRRQISLLDQLPDAIDRIARFAESGRTLEQCLRDTAADAPQPLARELTTTAHRMRVGASPVRALDELSDRTGLPAMAMLTTVLSIHAETGAEVSRPLFAVADDVREQLIHRDRHRAISAEGQWPAGALILLPMMTGIIFLSSESVAAATVLNSFVGRVALSLAAVLWCLGTIIVLRAVRVPR